MTPLALGKVIMRGYEEYTRHEELQTEARLPTDITNRNKRYEQHTSL